MTDATLRAWAYLSRVTEPPCAELGALVRRAGPVEAAERVRRGQVDDVVARRTEARCEINRAAADLELLNRRGGRLIMPDDDEWPTLAFAAFGGAAGGKARGRGAGGEAAGPRAAGAVAPRPGATRRDGAAIRRSRRNPGRDQLWRAGGGRSGDRVGRARCRGHLRRGVRDRRRGPSRGPGSRRRHRRSAGGWA